MSTVPLARGTSEIDVLVVGAGPTGLASAALLQSYGVAFRLIDRLADRVQESRALAVQPRTLEVLAGLGDVTRDLVSRGNRAVHLHLHAPGRVVDVPLFDAGLRDTAHPYLLFVSQAVTEAVLGAHLTSRGVAPERAVELVGLQQDANGVTCTVRHPSGSDETIRAGYVIGCDGARSTVRRLAGIPFEGAAYPQSFLLADVEADGLATGVAHAFLADAGPLFFFPLGSPASWRVLAMRPRDDPTPPGVPVTLARVQALVDGYTGATVRLRDPVWMTDFRLHNRGAVRYRDGRVFLAGDAAHIHSPAGAQGMNTGIQDAANLAWKLALVSSGRAVRQLLDTYEPERGPVGRRVLRFTDRAFTAATSTRPVLRFARTRLAPRVLPFVLRIPGVRGVAFRTVAELTIGYRHSVLSARTTPRRRLRPGDRVPDAPVLCDGEPRTLHTALATPGFHLLLCGTAEAWPPSSWENPCPGALTVHRLSRDELPGALRDRTGLALRRLDADRGAASLLVRPDGHLAWRGDTDLAPLRAYLARWLGHLGGHA
ncbi:FAD-dependent monooxygenase [Cellulomonas fimi]|uniref:Monooxygenase n=1 Tax=Cellulomonas fimi TaxID=1708 RepID=A0A7Y0M059_CELFI|nr:FAD-dependent monooxygenase [Cellulomonas fimi]NMR21156.1 monooxygenase [Cellulomonas fimi]